MTGTRRPDETICFPDCNVPRERLGAGGGAESPHRYLEGRALRKLTTFSYTPVFVFLDAAGKKVVETRGFRSEREARALHEYVTKRVYRKTSLREFLAAYPQ